MSSADVPTDAPTVNGSTAASETADAIRVATSNAYYWATQTALPTATATPTPAPTATPTPVPPILHDTGTGNKRMSNFSPNSRSWQVTWKCDRSSYYGYDYNVIIDVYNADTGQNLGWIVNALCENGNTGDTVEVPGYETGNYYLQIISQGWWDVIVLRQ